MGFANIVRVLRRHMIVSTLVLGLSFVAAIAFYVLTPTQYEASSTFVLFPGATPTDQLFANHPEYAKRNSENPYLNGGDVSTATAVLVQTMQSDDTRQRLLAQGADLNYVVAIDNTFLSGGQIISVTGTGTSAAMAETTARIVGAALPKQLLAMQTVNGAETPFLITARETLSADNAIAKTSGKLRSVVVIVVAGLAVLFGALTVLEAMAAARAERAASGRTGRTGHRHRGRAHDRGSAGTESSGSTPGGAATVATDDAGTRSTPTDPAEPAMPEPAAVVASGDLVAADVVAGDPVASGDLEAGDVAAGGTSASSPAPREHHAPNGAGTRRVAVPRSTARRAAGHPVVPGHPVATNGRRR